MGTQTRARATRPPSPRERRMRTRAYDLLREYQRRMSRGQKAPDPLLWPRENEGPELKRLGLKREKNGRLVERKR